MTELLVTTFHELRRGITGDGQAISPMTTVMSTAEAVSAGYAAGIHAYYYGVEQITPESLVQSLIGSALKESEEDLKKLRHYFNHAIKDKKGDAWKAYYEARQLLP